MSRKARCQHLLEKSVHAALSAIEIYNKPDFKYREESFYILMVNAWELLLKARILLYNPVVPTPQFRFILTPQSGFALP